jgi:hypothetical protein
MIASSLAAELLALPSDARVRRLVEVGRQSKTDPAAAAILARWEHGDWQERQWALLACWGSREARPPARLAAGPSQSLAGLALRLLSHLGEDDQLVRVLVELPRRRKRRLLVQLRRRGRTGPVNAFIAQLRQQGAREAFLYQALATDGQADDGGALDVTSWRRRALGRPEETADELVRALLAVAGRPDGLLFRAARAVLEVLSVNRPDLALKVLHSLRPHLPLSELPLARLLKRRPAEVADVVLSESSPSAIDFSRVVRRLDPGRLSALLERQPGTLPYPAAWLRELGPASRAELFRRFGERWRDGEECLPAALVGLLPGELRHAEARRHMELPALATRPLSLAAYCSFLPWPEARSHLRPFFQHPDAEMRAAAWSALTTAARYHGDSTAELLALVRERKYEQDPVRLAFLTGLAALPPRRWAPPHLPDLAGVVREALDATDLSPASTNALARLLWQLLPRQPEWTGGQLALLFRERGAVFYLPLEPRLTDQEARQVEDALLPVYATWRETNRDGWLVWLASCLGRRLRACPRLLDALRGVPALHLLRLHLPRGEFDELLADLLRRDPGWVSDPVVFRHLYSRRQDLLEPFLNRTYLPTRGGLHRCNLIHLLPAGGPSQLTARQQQTLGATLASITHLPPPVEGPVVTALSEAACGERSEHTPAERASGSIGARSDRHNELPRDAWALLLAIDRLSRLPAADHRRLVTLAAEQRLVVRDAALRALGRLDSGQGLPTLVEALADDRARVAIYAARSALAGLPADRVVATLRAVPLQKVTVAKEAMRLLGEFGGEPGFAWLREAAGQDLHRDVRIALLRALWDHLERPAAREILDEAAAAPDGRLLTGVLRIPADTLSEQARGWLIDLLTGLVRRPEPTVRIAVLERFAQMPVPDPSRRLIEQSIALLGSSLPDERRAAGQAVLSLAVPEDADRLAAAVLRLLPRRRPLAEWLSAFTPAAAWRQPRLEPVARALLGVVRTDPLLLSWEAALAAALDGAAGLRSVLERAGASGGLHADALVALEREIDGLAGRPDWHELDRLEADLAASADERLRRLAVTALSAGAGRDGWTRSRRARLERYRADGAPLVAGAAQFLFPPGE